MNKQLPVFATIRHTFLLTFNNLGPAFRLTWAWVVVLAATIAVFVWIIATSDVTLHSGTDLLTIVLLVIVSVVISLTAMASIAVAWHRYILLDEGGNVDFNLRLDGTVWRYAGNAILIALGSMIAFGIPMVFLLSVSELMFVLVLPALLLLSPFMYRLFIKLPAIALGRDDFGFADAFAVSRGNYWPFVGLAIAYFLVALAINLLVGVVSAVGLIFGPIAVVVQVIATAFAEWIGLIFGISLLTTLYGFFVEDRPLM